MLPRLSSALWIKSSVGFLWLTLTLMTFSSQVINPEQHLLDVQTVFERLSTHGRINRQGVTPLPQKVQVIRDFPQPKSPRQLRQFIGLVNFYHRFLPHCAELMIPLHALLSSCKPKSQSLSWSDSALAAFHATKEALAAASLLCYPQSDAPTSLATDASDTAIGVVLQQHIEGDWCPISFFSRKLTPAETRYSTFDKELLAIYLAIQHFRHFQEGRPFQVLTDHKPLTFALNSRSDHHSPRQARQLDYISQFTSAIRHICGLDNVVADTLSRIETHALLSGRSPTVDFAAAMAKSQASDPQVRSFQCGSYSLDRFK